MVETNSTNGKVQVTDDENGVDQQLKQQVMAIRETVDNDERELYAGRMRNPELGYTRSEANQDWALSVRQYLRSIKRLWSPGGKISGVRQYWEELPLGTVELMPPNTKTYQFTAMAAAAERQPVAEVRRQYGLPRGADVPRPYEKEFQGLKDILNTRVVEHSWSITVDDSGPPPAHERVTVSNASAVPKHVLENAVEAADAFLQQAGLGFETSLPDYYGGSEPGI